MNRYEPGIPRAICGVGAVAMTAINIGLLVVLPAEAPGAQATLEARIETLAALPPGERDRSVLFADADRVASAELPGENLSR